MRKRWTLTPTDEAVADHLRQALNIHPIFCRLLAQRGVRNFEEARAFFRPEWAHLHDPFLMKDMHAAVTRLQAAIAEGVPILLYGDYDVDGTTAVALMHEFLAPRCARIGYYIPDRYREGYGVSTAGVQYAIDNGFKLIVAMDCGITAQEQVAFGKKHGVDFIICDHHRPNAALPEAAAVLDPLRPDCPYPFKGLSGCGVAFKLAQAFLRSNHLPDDELHGLLDLLALSIAADIVPMTGENRVLAHLGLQRLNRSGRPGISALIELSGRQRPLNISDVVFGLAPLINAAGRLADADMAVRLLLSANKLVAADNARVLLHRNQLRKAHDQQIQEEAAQRFERMPDHEALRSIVLYDSSWHKGVIGIAAARMVERFHRPTILLTESNGVAVGSARSVPGFNIYEAIRSCAGLLTNFGGHDHAAGVTLPVEAVPAFQRQFEDVVRGSIAEGHRTPELHVAGVLELKDITSAFWRVLRQFEPHGPGNMSPVFVTKNVVDTGESKLLKGGHVQFHLRQTGSEATMQGIGFGLGEHWPKVGSGQPFHIAYKLEEDNWQGRSRLRLVVRDVW